ncbi:TPA: hypothetical protein QDB28_004033 [Burkholderia vietnamiensis]|nr:hypothetical protein [Burkholderia vietnamiensis]
MPATDREPGAHRRVYAKGFYDGLKAAEKEMTPAKFKIALDSQSAIARKIFEGVPIQDSWTANKIVTELTRMGGSTRVDFRTAQGCLDSLKDAGLIKEPQRGLFQRVMPRERETISLPASAQAAPSLDPQAREPKITITPPATDESTPISILGGIASALRTQAAELIQIADKIDTAAIGIEERAEHVESRLSKFRELSALLKEGI